MPGGCPAGGGGHLSYTYTPTRLLAGSSLLAPDYKFLLAYLSLFFLNPPGLKENWKMATAK